MVITLNAQARDRKESLDHIRTTGNIPAVFYGAKKESTPITLNEREFTKVWKDVGESSTLKLSIDGENVDVLIQDIQVNPVTGTPVHADFLAIDMDKPIEVTVALEFTGEAPAVEEGLGVLVKVLHEVDVEALPKNLPHEITVDLSPLKTLDDQILVENIVFPEGVTPITKGTEVVALVTAMKEETEEESAPIDLDSIEVEKKGKKEEETPEAE